MARDHKGAKENDKNYKTDHTNENLIEGRNAVLKLFAPADLLTNSLC